MKQTITFAGIFLILLTLSPSQDYYMRDNKKENETIIDIYYNPAAAPFTTIINWKNKTQRQNYDTILARKYQIINHEIHYMDSANKKVQNPLYEKEFLRIIYALTQDSIRIVGYIWVIKNLTIPGITYKPKPKPWEPKLAYARLDKHEFIFELQKNKCIALGSFQDKSFADWLQKTLEKFGKSVKRHRNLVKKHMWKDYLYAHSMLQILEHSERYFQETLNVWEQQKPNKTIWIYLTTTRMQEYNSMLLTIKQDIKTHGGKDWKKNWWEKMLTVWPSLRNI